MSINDKNVDIKELKKGIQMILRAFNEQKEQYLKIINSMKEKIISLEEQIMKLKEENILYQNKLYTLQKNIKCISKTICQIKDEDSIEDKNISDMDKSEKSISSEDSQNLKIKLTKDKNNDFFKKHSLNKLEMKKITKNNNKNHDINNYSEDEDYNYYSRDDDIQIKKKEKIDNNYMNKMYNTINNKKYDMNKKSESNFNIFTNDEKNDYIRYTENKSDKEIKEKLYNNNDSNQEK